MFFTIYLRGIMSDYNDFKSEVTILIAEDDDGHAELIHEHLVDAGVMNPQIRFRDGLEIWSFFSDEGNSPKMETNKPYLLLLDIRMPGIDGIEVLKRIKTEPRLKTIPVIMLTTTDDPFEIEECYRLGCNFYITKPVDFMKFSEILKRLGLFIVVIEVAVNNNDRRPSDAPVYVR